MTDLGEQVQGRLGCGTHAVDLTDVLDGASAEDALAGALLAIPVVVATMARVAESQFGAASLLWMLDTQQAADRRTPISGRVSPSDLDMTAALFTTRNETIIRAVAERSCLGRFATEAVLARTTREVLRTLADSHGASLDRMTMAAALARAQSNLVESGWATWINETVGRGDPGGVVRLVRDMSSPRPPDPGRTGVYDLHRRPGPNHHSGGDPLTWGRYRAPLMMALLLMAGAGVLIYLTIAN